MPPSSSSDPVSLAVILRLMGHDTRFRVVDGNACALERLTDCAVDIHLRLLIGCLCGVQSRFGNGERAFGIQRIEAGLGAEKLLLFDNVEGLLGQVERLLRCVHVSLSLLESKLRVANVEANTLLRLL